MLLIKGTRAVQVLFGIIVIFLLTVLSKRILHLHTLNWLLDHFWLAAAMVIAIVFQPELRSALAQLGTGRLKDLFGSRNLGFLDEIIPALKECSRKKIGVLIVLEHETGLKNFIETGTMINGEVSKELLLTLFYPKSPLHDGAVIIRDAKIIAAGCILPVSDNVRLSKELGTRHRAAVGITEISDAIALVVSEETGTVSLVHNAKILSEVVIDDLRKDLRKIYAQSEKETADKTKTERQDGVKQ
jgi:diadenylate cyclase